MRASRLSLILAFADPAGRATRAPRPAMAERSAAAPERLPPHRGQGPVPPAAAQMPGSVAPPMSPMMGAPPRRCARPRRSTAAAPAAARRPAWPNSPSCARTWKKAASAAKAASERKPAREEMCKQITGFTTPPRRNGSNSPRPSVAQLRHSPRSGAAIQAGARSAPSRPRKRSARPGLAARRRRPSLSDALGTTQLPTAGTQPSPAAARLDTLDRQRHPEMSAGHRARGGFDRQLGRSPARPPGPGPICGSPGSIGRSARGSCSCRAGGRRALPRSRPRRRPARSTHHASRSVLHRRLRDARGGLHLERHRRPRPRRPGRAHPLAADPIRPGQRRQARGVPRRPGAGRPRGARPVQPLRDRGRHRLARASWRSIRS